MVQTNSNPFMVEISFSDLQWGGRSDHTGMQHAVRPSLGDSGYMKEDRASLEQLMVRECLSGSETAWKELYARMIGLMRSVVRKTAGLSPEDIEDITQEAFLELAASLERYDFHQPLPRFVCLITERVVIDEYRKKNALKRIREEDMVECEEISADREGCAAFSSGPQHELIEQAQQTRDLREALRKLDPPCRKLLELRYFRELQFNEIGKLMGASKNTLIVRSRRCLEKLRTNLMHIQRKGQAG